jgi:hypothetical protein
MVSFAVGDPVEECGFYLPASNLDHYLVGRATIVCEGGTERVISIKLYAYHCQPFLWGCFWLRWSIGDACKFFNVQPGQTRMCPRVGVYRYGPVGVGSGDWALGAQVTVTDMYGNEGNLDYRSLSVDF